MITKLAKFYDTITTATISIFTITKTIIMIRRETKQNKLMI